MKTSTIRPLAILTLLLTAGACSKKGGETASPEEATAPEDTVPTGDGDLDEYMGEDDPAEETAEGEDAAAEGE